MVALKENSGEQWTFWSNKTSVPSQPFSEICFHDTKNSKNCLAYNSSNEGID